MKILTEDSILKYFFGFKLDWAEFNGVFDWHSCDTEEWFEENYKKFPKNLEFYKKYPITYHCNTDGFRSNEDYYEQKDREVDILLGCSHTFGVGHHVNNTWAHILSQKTGREVINLGVPGHGAETSYIVLNKFMPFYKVRNVFHYQPIYARYHVLQKYYEDNSVQYKHSTTNINSKYDASMKYKYSDEYKLLMLEPQMIKYEHYKNVDAIKSTCQRFDVKYYGIYDTPDNTNFLDNLEEGNIPSRDIYHFPSFTHRKIAREFYKMYKDETY